MKIIKLFLAINLVTGEKSTHNYDKLIIATGSYARGYDEANNKNIFTLKNLDEAKKLKEKLNSNKVKSVSILGAGFIGLELLEAFKEYQAIEEINIIDIKENITSNLIDKDFDEVILNELNKHKINVFMQTEILSITDNIDQVILKGRYLGKEIEFKNDLVIISKGFIPNTEFLSNLPLKKLPNGAIIVDKQGLTNIKNIYALGDCASIYHKILQQDVYIPLATIANKMGRVVADSIAGIKSVFQGTLGSSCLKVLDLEIAKTGITEYEAKRFNIPYKSVFVQDYNHTNYYPKNAKIFMKVIIDPNTHEIIGGQIVGKNGAMLRIHALSVAIQSKLPIQELGMLDFAYAPPFTRTWEALNILGNVATGKIKK